MKADSFIKKVVDFAGTREVRALAMDTLQVNLGYKCNMSCGHCHVNAGPHRTEAMTEDNINRVLRILDATPIKSLDLTGGAPELHPNFLYIVSLAKELGKNVLVRCNMTIFFERGMEFLPLFYSDHQVELVVSLPAFEKNSLERMRGPGVFEKSIEALRCLNKKGYGRPESGLALHLVYNPGGAYLPPAQKSLEKRYREILLQEYDIRFNNLFTFTNMPIGRFREFLSRTGNYKSYMSKLHASFNPSTLEGIMCRHMLNVGWDGTLYDCDFNQATDSSITGNYPSHLKDFDYSRLLHRPVAFKNHCFGCTAGQGST